MEEEVFRTERARNPNFAAKKVKLSKRRPVEALNDADTWLDSCVTMLASTTMEGNKTMIATEPTAVLLVPPTKQSSRQANKASAAKSKKTAQAKAVQVKKEESHRATSESPLMSEEHSDGSSELMDKQMRAPEMVAVKKLRVEEPDNVIETALFEDGAPDPTGCYSGSFEDDLCLGPMSMVLFDDPLSMLPETIF
jgi:hypothetical protein